MIVITMADILKYLNMLLIIAIANVLVVPVKILKNTEPHQSSQTQGCWTLCACIVNRLPTQPIKTNLQRPHAPTTSVIPTSIITPKPKLPKPKLYSLQPAGPTQTAWIP